MIYLVAIREHSLCKIGYAVNPAKRLAFLQTGNPFDLELIATREGGRDVEAAFHRAFAHMRVRGEWFSLCDDVTTAFAAPELPICPGTDCVVRDVFNALGGPTAIARGTGFPVQTVHSWSEAPAEIPPWRRPAVLDFARREKKLDGLSEEARSYLTSTERNVRQADAA